MDDATRTRIRARSRSLTRLLATAAGVDPAVRRKRNLRRSPLRSAMHAAVAARVCAGVDNRALTAALRAVWGETADDPPDEDADFAAHLATLVAAMRRLESGLADPVAAWDVVLTGLELRPSALGATDRLAPARLLARAAAHLADASVEARVNAAVRALATEGPGPWLARQGVTDLAAAFDERVERSLLLLEPTPDAVVAAAERAARNLLGWDAMLVRIHQRVSAARGEEAAQATVERFLDARVVAAYVALPAEEIERVSLTAGRHLAIAAVTSPERPGDVTRAADPTSSAADQLDARRRWARFFAAAQSRMPAHQLVFLWLSAGVGAGEAWRASSGDPRRVGSANYERNKAMEALRTAIGSDGAERLPNPGRPDADTRGLLALLSVRDADPCLERRAGWPADARETSPPLDDEEVVSLMRVFNVGPEGVTDAGRLVARALRHQALDRSRRLATARALAASKIDAHGLRFLLACRLCGLAGDADAWSREAEAAHAAAEDLAAAWPDLEVQAGGLDTAAWLAEALGVSQSAARDWLDAGKAPGRTQSPASHEIFQDVARLMRAARPAPPLEMPERGRPVEREAQLRVELAEAAR